MQPVPAWAEAILEPCASGLDVAQIDERLALTPTQRLERLQQFLELLHGFEHPDSAPR